MGWTILFIFLAESQNTDNEMDRFKFEQNVCHAYLFWDLRVNLVLAHLP